MGEEGLEPTPSFEERILSPLRLPITPLAPILIVFKSFSDLLQRIFVYHLTVQEHRL